MKQRIYQILYIIAGLLCVWFVVTVIVDAINYDVNATSFPFFAFVAYRMYQYILPAFVVFILGYIIKKWLK